MTAAPARIRIALVGAGAMGSLHARVITESQDAELAHVIDPSREVGVPLAERYRTTWLPDLDDMDDVDAVVVASPTSTHRLWAERAIAAGKAVLVEKPLSESLGETRALIDEARRHGVPMMCGLLERFNPALLTALQVVDDPVHVATIRHSPYVPRIVTGVGHDLLIHDVDLVLRMAGRLPDSIDAAYAYCHPKSEPGAEDIVEVTLRYDDGLLASLSASRVSQRKVRTLVVSELERLVEVDLVRQDVTVYRHVGNAAIDDRGPGYRQQTIIDIPTILQPREPLASQLDRFLQLARGDADAATELDTLLGPHLIVSAAAQASGQSSAQSPLRLVAPE